MKMIRSAVLLCGLTAALPCAAATFSENPIADAFVTTGPSGNLSSSNYGLAGALGVAAPGLPKGEFQSVLKFDLSGATTSFNTQFGAGQWAVQSITLQLTATASNNVIFNATAAGQFEISLMQNNSWTEGTGTPAAPGATGINYSTLQSTYINNAADENLGIFSYNGATSGAATYTLNLPPDLASDVLAGNILSLRPFAADPSVSYLFNSENFGTSGNRPLLTITAIPEPGSTALLAAGGLWLLGRRRWGRRKSNR